MSRPFDHIDWHLQVRASSPKKAEQIIKAFQQKAGARMRVTQMEEAWRNKTLFDVKLSCSSIKCEKVDEAIFRLLLMMRAVASGWQIKGPIDYDDDLWLFGALASSPQATFQVPGVEWANVELRNFPIIQQEKRE
jgi:hypothetical protein